MAIAISFFPFFIRSKNLPTPETNSSSLSCFLSTLFMRVASQTQNIELLFSTIP